MTDTLDQPTEGQTPSAITTSPPPSVGIFWGLREGDGPWELVHAALPLLEAEPYGDCLTYPGAHYDVWEGWRRLRSAGLRKRGLPTTIASHEYEHFPRGRIVYETVPRRFVLYADRRLQRPSIIDRLREVFGLIDAAVIVRSDSHYRTIPQPLIMVAQWGLTTYVGGQQILHPLSASISGPFRKRSVSHWSDFHLTRISRPPKLE